MKKMLNKREEMPVEMLGFESRDMSYEENQIYQKRMIVAIRDEIERARYEEILLLEKNVLLCNPSRGLNGLIDDIYRIRPDSVLMEVNFSKKEPENILPFRVIHSLMNELLYDTSKSLFGVTELEETLKKAETLGYNVLLKKSFFPEIKNS